MLTREQKIDFLKCCIAAYEDPQVQEEMASRFFGFCCLLKYYVNLFGHDKVIFVSDSLFCVYYPEFLPFIRSCRSANFYYFPLDKKGAIKRAQLAREFLKQEYGITVPKRKK